MGGLPLTPGWPPPSQGQSCGNAASPRLPPFIPKDGEPLSQEWSPTNPGMVTHCPKDGHPRLLMEDNLQWKTTFDGRRSSLLDDPQHKTTSKGRKQSL